MRRGSSRCLPVIYCKCRVRHRPLRDLGLIQGPDGPTLRVWSASATRIDLVIDDAPHDRVVP